MTEHFSEIVGNIPAGPYGDGVLERPCGTCGAEVGAKCVVDTFQGVRTRHMPCLSRLLRKENM